MFRFLLHVSFLVVAHTSTWYVSPFGDDNNSGRSSKTPFLTIPRAIKAVISGDTIYLENGIYGPNNAFTLPNVNLTIAAYNTISAAVTLTCQTRDKTFIQQTSGSYTPHWLTISQVRFAQCGLGAIRLYSQTQIQLNLNSVTFSQNFIGLYVNVYNGACASKPVTIVASNCVFVNNTEAAVSYLPLTSAASCTNVAVVIQSSLFQSNAVGIEALSQATTNLAWTIANTDFVHNTQAVVLQAMDSVAITECNFTRNGMSSSGSALSVTSSTVKISSSLFESNYATNGGAISLTMSSKLAIQSSVFHRNNASSNGGAIYAVVRSIVNLQSSTIVSNTAQAGGAFYCTSGQQSSLVCQKCILKNNPSRGGGTSNNCPTQEEQIEGESQSVDNDDAFGDQY